MTTTSPSHHARCEICRQRFLLSRLTPVAVLRENIAGEIAKSSPNLDRNGYICGPDLNRFRNAYIQSLIEDEKGEMTALDQDVVKSLIEHETVSVNVDKQFERALTIGERWSDRIADFGGSWKFIGLFFAVMVGWMAINGTLLLARPFDPYPFILLNLVLSCLAAIQAPIIMMSQNRQEDRDRLRADNDYRINLKAELEIRHLHEKVDHLLRQQWERLVEIQKIQIELLDEMTRQTPRR